LETWIAIQNMTDFAPIYPSMYDSEMEEPIIACGEAAWRNLEGVRLDYLLAAMMGGPIGITCDLRRVADRTLDALTDFIAEYKKDRAFWMDSECHILCDTESMLVLQFNDRAYSQIKICSFSKMPQQYSITVYPAIDTDGCFADETGNTHTAAELDRVGITLSVIDRYRAVTATFKRI
jgi:hypothetical protein